MTDQTPPARPVLRSSPSVFDLFGDCPPVESFAASDIRGDSSNCLICGHGPARLHRFVVMFRWVRDYICRPCWDIDTDEPKEDGGWDDSSPLSPAPEPEPADSGDSGDSGDSILTCDVCGREFPESQVQVDSAENVICGHCPLDAQE